MKTIEERPILYTNDGKGVNAGDYILASDMAETSKIETYKHYLKYKGVANDKDNKDTGTSGLG